MLRTAHNSPKLKRLKRRLGVPQYAAVGLLESLWHMTATQAQRGDIGKWSDEDIAAQLEWEGDEGLLIDALVACGWLDTHEKHRLVVHDWHIHADATVKRSPQVRDHGFVTIEGDSGVKEDPAPASDARLACDSHASAQRVTRQPEPVPEPEPEPDSGAEAAAPPSTRREARISKSAPVWEAYARAFLVRYGTEPPRNAKTNALLCQLVDRLGAEDAPQVAAFYVEHNARWYVEKGHSVAAMVADAEKLRTEWATGRTVTQTRARQIDRTASNFAAADEAVQIRERMEAETVDDLLRIPAFMDRRKKAHAG